MSTLDLGTLEIPPALLAMVPPDRARMLRVLPVRFEEETGILVVAMADPTDLRGVEALRFALDCKVRPVRADKAALDAAIDRYYPALLRCLDLRIAECESYRPFSLKATLDRLRCAYHALIARLAGRADDPANIHSMSAVVYAGPAVKLSNVLILAAIDENLSCVVLDLSGSDCTISFEGAEPPWEPRSVSARAARRVMRRIERMAGLRSVPKGGAQEGEIRLDLPKGSFLVHVKRESTEGGERLVIMAGPAEESGCDEQRRGSHARAS